MLPADADHVIRCHAEDHRSGLRWPIWDHVENGFLRPPVHVRRHYTALKRDDTVIVSCNLALWVESGRIPHLYLDAFCVVRVI